MCRSSMVKAGREVVKVRMKWRLVVERKVRLKIFPLRCGCQAAKRIFRLRRIERFNKLKNCPLIASIQAKKEILQCMLAKFCAKILSVGVVQFGRGNSNLIHRSVVVKIPDFERLPRQQRVRVISAVWPTKKGKKPRLNEKLCPRMRCRFLLRNSLKDSSIVYMRISHLNENQATAQHHLA